MELSLFEIIIMFWFIFAFGWAVVSPFIHRSFKRNYKRAGYGGTGWTDFNGDVHYTNRIERGRVYFVHNIEEWKKYAFMTGTKWYNPVLAPMSDYPNIVQNNLIQFELSEKLKEFNKTGVYKGLE